MGANGHMKKGSGAMKSQVITGAPLATRAQNQGIAGLYGKP